MQLRKVDADGLSFEIAEAGRGNERRVLLVHGFTGTPQSVRYWAEGIAADGRTVILPRLPGHGTTPDDMQRTTAAEWVAEAEMGLRGLQERCDRIFVVGLSMGGTITFDLAERFQTPVFMMQDLDIGMNDWVVPRLKWDGSYQPDRGRVLIATRRGR